MYRDFWGKIDQSVELAILSLICRRMKVYEPVQPYSNWIPWFISGITLFLHHCNIAFKFWNGEFGNRKQLSIFQVKSTNNVCVCVCVMYRGSEKSHVKTCFLLYGILSLRFRDLAMSHSVHRILSVVSIPFVNNVFSILESILCWI